MQKHHNKGKIINMLFISRVLMFLCVNKFMFCPVGVCVCVCVVYVIFWQPW